LNELAILENEVNEMKNLVDLKNQEIGALINTNKVQKDHDE